MRVKIGQIGQLSCYRGSAALHNAILSTFFTNARASLQSFGSLSLITTFLRLLLPPERDVDSRIPGVVDTDEEQEEYNPTNHEQRQYGIAPEEDSSHQRNPEAFMARL